MEWLGSDNQQKDHTEGPEERKTRAQRREGRIVAGCTSAIVFVVAVDAGFIWYVGRAPTLEELVESVIIVVVAIAVLVFWAVT